MEFKMKYYIPASWHQSGFHVIEAESLEDAERLAYEDGTPTLTGETLDTLPPPHQEEQNDDYEINPRDIRPATAKEIALAEAPSWKEALRQALEAMQEMCDALTEYKLRDVKKRFRLSTADAAIAKAMHRAKQALEA